MADVSVLNNRKRAGTRRRSGVLAPLFSLYSRESFGVGDTEDLKLFVDWCVKTGNSIMQLLPMNEVGDNFCPYESISSFAIEPVYAPVGRGSFKLSARRVRADYGVKGKKRELLRRMYIESGGILPAEAEKFRRKNSWWIEDFCMFKVLKRRFGFRPWYEWSDAYRNRSSSALKEVFSAERAEMDFEAWVQWFLYERMREFKAYAGEKGVLVMGDLPVVINRDSADVWAHPEFFKMELAAGAPPDMFCVKGQRWGIPGMPTYDWEKIEGGGWRYIREKLKYAEEFYDILRIDHVVGLFRIWSIPIEEPLENEGLNGFFDPPDEKLWREHGRKILSAMLESTGMLLCGEDLGVIPDACPEIMKSLGIPGIDVQRWKKEWRGSGDFLPPEKYRQLSVAALSTHDTSNWNDWWERESSAREREQMGKLLGISVHPEGKASPKITEAALKFILEARSVFSIQLIFDWLNLSPGILKGWQSAYRINTPGTVSGNNWSAVLPVFLEELMSNGVCDKIRTLIAESGRLP
ncbi:MAG: 4-alpha-glucanotransferase [Candidatus Omnitrophica bacterium]|nr:4-alpha-glucanotransferase [Candidatus Omnitrophota bacterium]